MPARSVVSDILESVETELLGRRGVSFSVAKKQSGWARELADSSCWRCAGSVGPHETDGDGCADCREKKLPWDRSLRLGTHSGILRDAVIDLKFRRWALTGRQLGMEFGSVIGAQIHEMGLNPEEVALVPIPMTQRRRIKRGVDHTLVLARGVSKVSHVPIQRLLRARNRAEQVGLTATDRIKNMRGAFFTINDLEKRLLRKRTRPIRAIIVFDDVRTTGATLEEGCRTLKRSLNRMRGDFVPEIWAASVSMAGSKRKGGVVDLVGEELLSKGGEIEQEDDA